MFIEKDTKTNRILMIYSKLISGKIINKKELSKVCNVSEKTIQRDIEDIKAYFYDKRDVDMGKDIEYIPREKGYYLKNNDKSLSSQDVLAMVKVLLESRAFCREELNHIISSLLKQVEDEQSKYIYYMIGNELSNYTSLKHGSLILSRIWNLSELIINKEMIKIKYRRADNSIVKRVVKPVSIIFSEYYFYLMAYFDEYDSPSVFRIDRIKEYEKVGKKFYIPYPEEFKDGEFRKRVQFMHPGKLIKVRFEFSGGTLEAVMDRLPTARIIKQESDKATVEAEVYGKGIIMWLLSQGSKVKVLSPDNLVVEIKEEINKMYAIYS